MINQINNHELTIIIRELKKSLSDNKQGSVVEFGCYDGGTSIFIAREIEKTNFEFFVYDSFEGLPEKTINDTSPLGAAFKPGELAVSKKQFIKNIQKAGVTMPVIKKGWFNELQPNDIPKNICFAFLDGDYYDSIKTSLRLIEKNLSRNVTIIIDDYANDFLPGVSKATDEWLRLHPKATKKIEQSLAILYLH